MTNYAFVLDANGKQLAPTKEQNVLSKIELYLYWSQFNELYGIVCTI